MSLVSQKKLAPVGAILLGVLGAHSSALQPLLIGYLIAHGGLPAVDAGLLAAASLFGTAVAIVSLSLLSTGLQRAPIAMAAAALLLGANLYCALSPDFPGLLAGRFMAGAAEGVLVSLMTGYIGRSSAPERLFAAFFATHIVFTSLVVGGWAHIVAIPGVAGPFAFLAAVGGLAGVAALLYPSTAPPSVRRPGTAKPAALGNTFVLALAGLFGIYLFNVAVMGVWSFVVPFARTRGLSDSSIQTMLLVSQIGGFGGAMVPLLFSRVLGGTIPIVLGLSLLILVSVAAGVGAPRPFFFVGGPLYVFGWVLLNPYMSGAVATLDRDGRYAVASFASMYLGLASGPAITGWLSKAGWALATVFLGFSIVFAICCAIILAVKRFAVIAAARPPVLAHN
jgi:predicted MFS family arabinose efflux permease